MKYKKIFLKDILEEKGYIRGPFGSALRRAELKSEGIPVYEQQNAIYNHRNFRYFIDEKKFEELRRFQVKTNDLIISCSGTVGRVSKIKENDEKGIISQALLTLRPDVEIINPDYLYYFFVSKEGRHSLLSRSSGSVQVNIAKRNIIENIHLPLPEKKIQKKIVDILNSLDSKIELNNQIISNLEELASTLFKRWFVDFEFPDENGNPYKSSGGKMVDSELGEIPEGWEITELKSIVDVVDNRGKTPPLEKDKTDFPIIDVKTLSGNGRVVNYNKAQKYVSEETYSSWFRSGHPKINDILISTVGSIGEIKMFLTDKGTIAQNVVGLRAKKHLEYHLYQFLLYNKSNLITYNIGSVQPSIKVTHLLKHKVLLPNKKDLNKFNSVMIGLTDKIINLSKEINSLTEIRDSLLPKLLSGEVELPEDEEV